MAKISMSYILIEKSDITESLDQIILGYLDNAGFTRNSDGFIVGSDEIHLDIKHKKDSQRVYVRLSSSMRFSKGINSLQKLDDSIFKSDFQKYAYVIRDYDGISSSISEKLYPKYSQFERGLRQLILLVLTKAFGSIWRNKTISKDDLDKLKEKAKGGNISLTETLELFDLKEMEDYLFQKHEVDSAAFEKLLSENNIKNLSKDEICKIIDELRPQSLWNRNFSDVGDEEKWKKQIEEIHDCRNKVAHHRHISIDEYKVVNRRLNVINKQLLETITEIQKRDFTSSNTIDILGSFVIATAKIANELSSKYDYSQMLSNVNSIIQTLVKPIVSMCIPESESIKQMGKMMVELAEPLIKETVSEQAKELSLKAKGIFESNSIPQIPQSEIAAINTAWKVNNMVINSKN